MYYQVCFNICTYMKIETVRLQFIRFNQKKLRAKDYIHHKDSVSRNDNSNNFGRVVTLPSTFISGPRHLSDYVQDALIHV